MGSIRLTADWLLYYMSQSYAVAATPSPPANQENWDTFVALLGYYMMRGWTFT